MHRKVLVSVCGHAPKWMSATIAPERAPTIVPREEVDTADVGAGSGYIVVVYDNDYNTLDEVVRILRKATGCTMREAAIETWEIHHLGKSVVHHGEREECERVAGIIRTIGIRVEVLEE